MIIFGGGAYWGWSAGIDKVSATLDWIIIATELIV